MGPERIITLAAVADRIGTPEQWRREHTDADRPIIWDQQYGAPEASLVLDSTTLDLADLTWLDVTVIRGFCMIMHGRFGSSYAAGPYAKEQWGITHEDLGLDINDSGSVRRALFDTATHYGFFGRVEDKPRVSRTMRTAPTVSFDRSTFPSGRFRNTYTLQSHGLASCPVPRRIVTTKYFRDLFPEAVDLLFALYGLNDLDLYGGVDPTHMHLDGPQLIVSDSLIRSWRHDEQALADALAGLYDARLVAFVPADLQDRRWYPAGDRSMHYLGDTIAPDASRFVIRPVIQVEQFAGSWAA